MQQKLPRAFCLLIALFLLSISCQKEPVPPNNVAIAEAKSFFDTHILSKPQTPADTKLRHKSSKKALWNQAYTKVISIGQAVIVPLQYSPKIFVVVGKNRHKEALEHISYLMLYKDQKGSFHAEVITQLADDTSWDSGKAFSGLILVEDWWGKPLKAFRIQPDGSIQNRRYTSSPSKGPDLAIDRMSRIEKEDCTVIVTTNDQGMYEVELNCSTGDDGINTGGGSGWDGGGGGNWNPGYEGLNRGGGGGTQAPSGRDYQEDPRHHGSPRGNPQPEREPDLPASPDALDTIMTPDFYKNEKAMCALSKLMQNNYYKTTLNNFIGENKPLDLTFKILAIGGPDVYGDTKPNPFNWNSNNIDLRLNENAMDNLSSIEVALTLLHEGIHAEMYRKLLSINGTINLSIDNFPSLFNMYSEYKNDGQYQHQFMANYYIDIMSAALKQYDGNRFSLDYYQALAWEGLHGTDVWKNKPAADTVAINNKAAQLLSGRSKIKCNDLYEE